MTWSRLLFAAAVLAGLASGSSALTASAEAQPPLTWPALAFVGLGTAVALPAVLGLQAALRNQRALKLFWHFFLYVAVYHVATGIAALVVAARGSELLPHAFLFLVIGLGLSAGVGLTRLAFLRRRA